MAGTHSDWAPSSLPMVEICPGSWRANLAMPEVDSIYSAKGTFGHSIAALCFDRNCDADEYLGHSEIILVNGKPHEFIADERFINAIQKYLDYCRELLL